MRTTCILNFGLVFVIIFYSAIVWAADPEENVQGANRLFAGAAAVNIDPPKLPVIRNGGFTQRIGKQITQSLFARSLVLRNGKTRIAICVVDTCMVDRELCDKAKDLITKQTGIPSDRILISATHTHSAPSAMRCLGCPADPQYPAFLIPRIAGSVSAASNQMAPAEAGWAVADAGDFTNTRRWIYLPHKMKSDPFGRKSVRAMMHPGYANPATAGPSGPEDPDLTLLSIRTREGKPLAVLGNLSQHYYAKGELSSGYTGTFCKLLEEEYGSDFVGLMSQGTSGDLQHMDYGKPRGQGFLKDAKDHYTAYCRSLADLAIAALEKVEHRADCVVAMDEQKLTLNRRMPNPERVAWAKPIVESLGESLPRDRPQVYAREVFWIRENPIEELKLQTIRIGEFGIATLPNEVYAITGLKLKMQSPLRPLMNIELANGAAGYIPPPEQHYLGGYTTWPARTAGLEVEAEPKIVETLLDSLSRVSGRPRVVPRDEIGTHGKRILSLEPKAWWRMSAHSGNQVVDASGNNATGQLEPGYALFLGGPEGENKTEMSSTERGNRAVHFAGGRMMSTQPELNRGDDYSVSLWFWNAMPVDDRAVTGYFFSLGQDKNKIQGDHLGITGTALGPTGRLLFYNGDRAENAVTGETELDLHRWYHVMLVREGESIRVHLDGNSQPEIESTVPDTRPGKHTSVFVGGRSDGMFCFEGKIDEVAIYDRALKAEGNPAGFLRKNE